MNLEKIGRQLIILGLLLLLTFTFLFVFNSTKLNLGPINTEVWSHYAGVISGIVGTTFSLVGVLFLIINLRTQRTTSLRQQVETRFFELVQLHRDNVTEIQSKGKKGRPVFIDLKDEFHEIHELVQNRYNLAESTKSQMNWDKDCIQIAYLILFFGVDNSSTNYLEKVIRQTITNKAVQDKFIINCLTALVENHKQHKDKSETGFKKGFFTYDGHQSRLGHYFRHIFQTVTYINRQPSSLFTYEEKYEYIKTLRAQLSTHEQAIFFYNSISPLGNPWELDKKIVDDNLKLITKYNLIKNLPEGFTKGLNPKTFFPDIFYEFDENKTQNRIELEKHYS